MASSMFATITQQAINKLLGSSSDQGLSRRPEDGEPDPFLDLQGGPQDRYQSSESLQCVGEECFKDLTF